MGRNERECGVHSEVISNGTTIFILRLRINNSAFFTCSCEAEVDEWEQVLISQQFLQNSSTQ